MKTIGLLGGMSWESTQTYYQLINQGIRQKLGKLHSAQIVLISVDFELIENCQRIGDWETASKILQEAAKRAEAAGADCLLICTNTMHKVFKEIQQAIAIPLLHIADATGQQLVNHQVKQIGLLGTAFTMEQTFYKQRLTERFGIEVIIPDSSQRKVIHQVIYQELCLGKVLVKSKQCYLEIIEDMRARGAEGVILGCTEIGLLVNKKDTSMPLYDTTRIHAMQAVEFALG